MLLPHLFADLIQQATRTAQKKGDLPTFALPEVTVTRPRHTDQGDLSTALPLQIIRAVNEARKEKGDSPLSPVQVGEMIARRLPGHPALGRAEVAKPGFINLRLHSGWVAAQAGAIARQGADYFRLDLGRGQRVQVRKYASMNSSSSPSSTFCTCAVSVPVRASLTRVYG